MVLLQKSCRLCSETLKLQQLALREIIDEVTRRNRCSLWLSISYSKLSWNCLPHRHLASSKTNESPHLRKSLNLVGLRDAAHSCAGSEWVWRRPPPVFDLPGWGLAGFNITHHWMMTTSSLVAENFCLGCRLRPRPDQFQQKILHFPSARASLWPWNIPKMRLLWVRGSGVNSPTIILQ